jgi:hypothetical protein
MAAGSLVVPLLSSRPRVLATDAFVTSCLTSPERKAFVYDREGQYFSDVRY